MANLLRNCENFAVPYLDDIAIFSLAWEDHLKHLKDVFDRLRSAKLHIKPSKCQFAQAYVKYLGHLVGQGLRTPGELKVQVIKDFPIPTNKTQDRNRKSTADWSSSCQNAFEELKTRLSKNPVLYNPDFTKPFIIQCDASNLGIGVVLSQVCENEEHPIMFLSKKLSLAEQQYSTTEKECAAIIFAVQKLKCYLDGHQKFVIQTDHNLLVWTRPFQSEYHLVPSLEHHNLEKPDILTKQTISLKRIPRGTPYHLSRVRYQPLSPDSRNKLLRVFVSVVLFIGAKDGKETETRWQTQKRVPRDHGRKAAVALGVKVTNSWQAFHEIEPAEDPPCRGGRCMLNMSRLKRLPVDGVNRKLGKDVATQFRCRPHLLTMVKN
ncbi:retrovirus-related Pol polyprotein from transposon 297 [Trichonephila clavipes]|nr:retrovirus-related Pol polyprotein from transposon 297 [Trichonephila clavipes]